MKNTKLIMGLCALLALTGCATEKQTTSENETSNSVSSSKVEEEKDGNKNGLDMVVTDSGYYTEIGEYDGFAYITYWATLHNPNKDDAIFWPVVYASAKDENGTIIGASEMQGANIAPKDTVLVVGSVSTGTTAPTTVEITIGPTDFEDWFAIPTSDYETKNVTEVTNSIGYESVTGEATYHGDGKDLSFTEIYAVYKKDGKIVYAVGGDISLTAPEQTVPFEVNSCIENVPEHDSVEIVLQGRQ